MTWTTPKTWVVDELVTATLMNEQLRDNLAYLHDSLPKIALLCDEKPYNVAGGTFTSGAWRTRDLNTILSDEYTLVTLASNQFTLQAGMYWVEASAPALMVGYHTARLYNVTNSLVSAYGTSEFSRNDGTSGDSNRSFLSTLLILTTATTFEVQHRCSATRTTNGFGAEQSTDADADTRLTMVKIIKLR